VNGLYLLMGRRAVSDRQRLHVFGIPKTWKLVGDMEITPKRASTEMRVRQTNQVRH
jgi:hypothetical protein